MKRGISQFFKHLLSREEIQQHAYPSAQGARLHLSMTFMVTHGLRRLQAVALLRAVSSWMVRVEYIF